MDKDQTIELLKENSLKFRKACAGTNFIMRQYSDAIEENKFDHLTFVSTQRVEDVLANQQPLIHVQNDVVEKKYKQLFMKHSIYNSNKKYLDKHEIKESYVMVNDYDEMFNGMMGVGEYLVLANSSKFDDEYPVFILIDSENQDIRIGKKQKKLEFWRAVMRHFSGCSFIT